MTTDANIRFEDWEAEQMKDPEFRAAVKELEPEYQAAREEYRGELAALKKKIANMERWIAWRDELLREALKQIGVEWHPILLLPAVGYRRLVYEYNRAKERVLELEAEVHALGTMLDCHWEREEMDRHLRHRVQRALRCFASVLVSNDPKAYAKAFGWAPQRLRKLVDDMHPPSVNSRGRREGAVSDTAKQRCICGEELDALGICKALPYFSNPLPRQANKAEQAAKDNAE